MITLIKKWILALLILSGMMQQVWANEAVAMVTDIVGGVTITAQGKSENLALLAYLEPNSEIRLEKNAKLVVTYFTQPQAFVFNGPARIRINADGPSVISGGAAETRHLAQSSVGSAKKFSVMQREKMAQATFEMRGFKAGVRLLGPMDTLISIRTPEFAWSGPADAKEYLLTLNEEGGKTIQRLNLADSSWHVTDVSLLEYGKSYQWRIETTLSSGETLSASGRFSVLDEEKSKAIAALRPAADADFSERLLYATRLETEGLKHEAKAQWQILSKERPNDIVLQEQAAH